MQNSSSNTRSQLYRRRAFYAAFLQIVRNDFVHAAASDSHYRRPARLTLQCRQSKCFLDTGMDEEIGGAVVAGQLAQIGTITNPRNVFSSRLEFPELSSFGSIANDEQLELIRTALLQKCERRKQSCHVLFFGKTADIKKEFFLRIETKRAAYSVLL